MGQVQAASLRGVRTEGAGTELALMGREEALGRTLTVSTQMVYTLSPATPANILAWKDGPMAQVNFRMKDERLALIDRAAAIRGVTRTEFVLRSSEAAAIETLNERPVIALDDDAYDAFVAALDAPVESNDRLKKQFARQPLWER